MKTFADVKRRVRVGTVLVQTYSVLVRPEGPQTELLPPRKVVKVQTNAWKLEGCAYSKGKESWLPFPKTARTRSRSWTARCRGSCAGDRGRSWWCT
jgi:hypothetical protein